ncbi:peptidase M1 [Dokdonia pacifica]|uniref:Peptidase family M1 n=1 Tax=Dokdonia pacifica TaxID=1627892 RepID=A0A238YP49_9FLAO|nr:M1 family metallopeptidase [Dokdonia pacifica]GGG10880.1 peptidase M1 [Dokdonia pacifica]SNR73046.1 Peptidase family M1 [Dokdonia pacifica]
MKYIIILFLCISTSAFSQKFTREDTIRGSITPERAWWDLNHYDLSVDVDPDTQLILGTNKVTYTVLEEGMDELQIDLQVPMELTAITQDGIPLHVRHDGDAHFITLKKKQEKGAVNSLVLGFEGQPRKAKNAPWDGGFSWKKDAKGRPFIATSNQGIGASVWWPNKDHNYDEVDSLDMHVTVPKDLVDVSNGRLVGIDSTASTKTYHWTVKNPINSYGVNLNIGKYTHFKEVYQGENGPLDMDYWVIEGNEEKAKEQFKQAPMMMEAFEHWFGPYPFYEDSYKLVEAPYLGMEHQSSVTYGNKYQNGYLGRDLSRTDWGLKFDFIIIHESGHEWFANNITSKDVADMWIHESFTNYSESLYLDYHFGKQAASEYVIGTRKNIQNDKPIIGTYDVRKTGSGSDMYYKGGNMLHMLRTLVEDDEQWRAALRGLNTKFCHQTVTTKQVENYLSVTLKKDLNAFFNQYLRTTKIPVLEYQKNRNKITFRYTNVVNGFDMPIQMVINGEKEWIYPSKQWRTYKANGKIKNLKIADDFYVELRKINP